MKDIIDEMLCEGKKILFGNNILLAAHVAVRPMDNGPAVQAVFFFTLCLMTQANFLLKIDRKKGEKKEMHQQTSIFKKIADFTMLPVICLLPLLLNYLLLHNEIDITLLIF